MIYLDNASTTKVKKQVLDAMLPYFTEEYGNAGSIHTKGTRAYYAIQDAREKVARPINADPQNIIFTSGGSESNTMAIIGLMRYLKSVGKTHIITTQVEHHSVLKCIKHAFDNGFSVTYLPVDENGNIDLDDLEEHIFQKTGLVSVMTVNNETGNLYPIQEIGKICHRHNVLFHTDCVQGYCQADVDVVRDHIDLLSASGHKIHAPKGIGLLYAANREILSPVIMGGGQEYGLRGGTENIPGIVGFGEAADIMGSNRARYEVRYETMQAMVKSVLEENRCVDFKINGMPYFGSKIMNIRFDGVDGETLLLLLDSCDVEASAGSACSAHSAVPSHVLTAMGLTDEQAKSSIRVSFSDETTGADIHEAMRMMADSVNMLRRKQKWDT